MSQERFHNYQRPVDSDQENKRLLGLFEPGRYRGFDGFSFASLTASIYHTSTGIIETAADNTTQSAPKAVWVSPLGTIIKENAILNLTFDTNSGNTHERIDLIYGEHQWLSSPGGQAAIYGVVKGSMSSTVKPVLAHPKYQVVLGYIHIPAGATDLTSATWECALVPNIANASLILNHPELDARYARLAAENVFSKLNQWKEVSSVTVDGVTAKKLTLGDGGNTYGVVFSGGQHLDYIETKQNGTILFVAFASTVILGHNKGSVPSGYTPLLLPQGVDHTIYAPGLGGYPNAVDKVCMFLMVDYSWELIASSENVKDIKDLFIITSEHTSNIGDLQNIVALENWSFINPAGGSAPAFGTGWANVNATLKKVKYRKQFDQVNLVGECRIYSYSFANKLLFTLPVGYRPSDEISFVVASGPVGASGTNTVITVGTNGDVSIDDSSISGGSYRFVALNLTFPLD